MYQFRGQCRDECTLPSPLHPHCSTLTTPPSPLHPHHSTLITPPSSHHSHHSTLTLHPHHSTPYPIVHLSWHSGVAILPPQASLLLPILLLPILLIHPNERLHTPLLTHLKHVYSALNHTFVFKHTVPPHIHTHAHTHTHC